MISEGPKEKMLGRPKTNSPEEFSDWVKGMDKFQLFLVMFIMHNELNEADKIIDIVKAGINWDVLKANGGDASLSFDQDAVKAIWTALAKKDYPTKTVGKIQ